jgi:hypothetical protein
MSEIFGPKIKDHPSVGHQCVICEKPFEEGDYTMLISIGPSDEVDAENMKTGRPFTAKAREVHSYCLNPKEKVDNFYDFKR